MTSHYKHFGFVAEKILMGEAMAAMSICGDPHPEWHLRSMDFDREDDSTANDSHILGTVFFVRGDAHYQTKVDLHLKGDILGNCEDDPEVLAARVEVKAKRAGEISYHPEHVFACRGEEALREVEPMAVLV